jgi:hypothetical protein
MPNIQSNHELNTTVYLKDVKPANTAGGTFTSGAWQPRIVNTLENSATSGFGVPRNFSVVDIYTQVEIQKIG